MSNYKETKRAIKDKNGNVTGYQKCIIADMEHLTVGERQVIEMYMKTGEYKIIPKKEKKKSGNGLTKDKIRSYLQDNDKEGLKEYENKLKQKENFMRIMVWFKNKYPNYEEKAQ